MQGCEEREGGREEEGGWTVGTGQVLYTDISSHHHVLFVWPIIVAGRQYGTMQVAFKKVRDARNNTDRSAVATPRARLYQAHGAFQEGKAAHDLLDPLDELWLSVIIYNLGREKR